jgi:hypothetical protein
MSYPYADNYTAIIAMAILFGVSVMFLADCLLYLARSRKKTRPSLEFRLIGITTLALLGTGSIPFLVYFDAGLAFQLMTIFCVVVGILLGMISLLRFAGAFPVLKNHVLGLKWMTFAYSVLFLLFGWMSTITTSVC